MSHDLKELERLLRTTRATPRPEFVGELERALASRERDRPVRRRLRVLVAGSGLVAVLTTAAVVLAVAGLLPFGSSGGRAEADEHCTIKTVERVQRRAHFARDRHGNLYVRYRPETLPRIVRRCR